MAADRHLPEIRDFQPDPAWKQFFADAIDPARHKGLFKDVRDYLAVAEAGGAAGMDAEEALSKAEAKLQEFDGIRQYCAEAIARWHAAAQI
ncbi:MAG: hypothetical protein E5V67_22600, partial [Mesorhizobium sp.]